MRMGVPLRLSRTMSSDVFERADVAAAAHHVFGAAELEQPPAGFGVAGAHGLHDAPDGDAVGLEPVGIEVDLELLAETADRRDFGHARHGFEVIAQIPILAGAQIGQGVGAGLVDQRVLKDPAQRGGVRPHHRGHALRQARQHRGQVFLRARRGPSKGRCLPRR